MVAQIEKQITTFWQREQTQYWLLGGIVVLAAVLRFFRLGAWSFWIDEIYTINRAGYVIDQATSWPPILRSLSIVLTHYVIDSLGTTEWTARLVPNLIGIASIPIIYFSVRRLFSPVIGLITVLLLAVSPWHLFWSQNARFYTALMLFYFLACLAFFVAIEQDRPIFILIGFILFYLAASERLTAFFLGPVVVSYLVLLKMLPIDKPPGFRLRNLLLISLPVIAIGFIQAYKYAITGAWLFPDISIFIGTMNTAPLRLSASIAYRIGVPLLVMGGFTGIYLISLRQRVGLYLLVAALLPVVLLLLLSPFAFTVDRYIFMTLPFWIVLAAVGIQTLFEQTGGQVRLLVIGILALLMLSYLGDDLLYFEFQNGNRPDWKAAFSVLEKHEQEGDLVFTTRPELGSYYLAEDVQSIHDLDLEFIQSTDNRTWLVIDEATSMVSHNLSAWINDNSILVDIFDVNLPGKSLSIRLYLYVPAEDG